VHCPDGAEALTLLDSTFEVLLAVIVADLLVETEDEVLVEGFTLLLVADEIVERLDDFTVLVITEELLELLLVKEVVLPTLLDLTFAHTNCVCPISHAPLMLNDSKRMLSIAFKFAPEKVLRGIV
jgi:hypothetical protein